MSFVLSLGRNEKQNKNKQTASIKKKTASEELNNSAGKVLFSKDVIRHVSSADRRNKSTRISRIEFVLCGDKCSSWGFVFHVTCI